MLTHIIKHSCYQTQTKLVDIKKSIRYNCILRLFSLTLLQKHQFELEMLLLKLSLILNYR